MSEALVTRWWWIRHAPVSGPPGLLKGRLDLPSDTSDAALFTGQAALLPQGAVCITSTRLRTRQTYQALVEAGFAGGPPVAEPGFDEQDFGQFEGRIWGALGAEPAVAAFLADPANVAPPGGESFAALVQRVGDAIARVGARHAGEDIVVVAHAGTIRAALAVALGISPAAALAFAIEHVSLTRIDAVGAAWRVLGVSWLAMSPPAR